MKRLIAFIVGTERRRRRRQLAIEAIGREYRRRKGILSASDGYSGKVLLDGVDVSSTAYQACPESGWVDLYAQPLEVRGGRVLSHRRHGHVEFIPREAA